MRKTAVGLVSAAALLGAAAPAGAMPSDFQAAERQCAAQGGRFMNYPGPTGTYMCIFPRDRFGFAQLPTNTQGARQQCEQRYGGWFGGTDNSYGCIYGGG